ncbi:hypothetical protein [Nonomuraea sediminis]|uniref:hypothetical protein n=1 Tax=Nonomuraea sediminis TaxID=2835864 RepID=UPI001BDD1CAE|nr:hypothetical protein [Nonomuraea sediminis]
MNALRTTQRVEAFHTATKKLGRWTDADTFKLRAHRGYAVLDLRAVEADEIEIRIDAERSALKLLVPDEAVIDQWDLRMIGRGKVKDWTRLPGQSGPRIRLLGEIRHGEVRISRGGVAVLTAMLSREFLNDCHRAHREGGSPTVHDPA